MVTNPPRFFKWIIFFILIFSVYQVAFKTAVPLRNQQKILGEQVSSGGEHKLRQIIHENAGWKEWYRDCQMSAVGAPDYNNCSNWIGPKDLRDLRGGIQETYDGVEHFLFAGGQRLLQTYIGRNPISAVGKIYRRICTATPTQTITCNNPWQESSSPLPVGKVAIAHSGFYYPTGNNAYMYREAFIDSTGHFSWYRECPMSLTDFNGPNFSACRPLVGPISLTNLRGGSNEGYSGFSSFTYYILRNQNWVTKVQQQLIDATTNAITRVYMRDCTVTSQGRLIDCTIYTPLNMGTLPFAGRAASISNYPYSLPPPLP